MRKEIFVTPGDIENFFEKYPCCESAAEYHEQIENGSCIALEESIHRGWDILHLFLTPTDIKKFIHEMDYEEEEED